MSGDCDIAPMIIAMISFFIALAGFSLAVWASIRMRRMIRKTRIHMPQRTRQ